MKKKKIHIEMKDWIFKCGDGCCFDSGVDIYVNGNQLDEGYADNTENALRAVLEHLGYEVDIEWKEDEGV
jgi:hypothetical protein